MIRHNICVGYTKKLQQSIEWWACHLSVVTENNSGHKESMDPVDLGENIILSLSELPNIPVPSFCFYPVAIDLYVPQSLANSLFSFPFFSLPFLLTYYLVTYSL